ncbi:helix-turn-helix domain-containing protein [Streptomyces sp. NPDC085946]|uniref:helix-turn-helix domain-containing protein n=1 Tax=Streptomyces sp. NPDC085946 TaxID=3365744 RepID=UPI0037D58A1E
MDTSSHAAAPPVRRFAAQLRRLRISAGEPQIKTIAARAQCSQATVSEALNGRRLPSETVTHRLVVALGGDWEHWREVWRATRTELDVLRREGPGTGMPPYHLAAGPSAGDTAHLTMVHYPDPPAFYRAAADGIRRARSEIRLTYVRLHPPGQWGAAEADAYYRTVLDWARSHSAESASVRRVIGVPEVGGVPKAANLAWLREHQAEIADIYAYEARVMPWAASFGWYNMGLIDDTVSYLSFSGVGRQQLKGFSVEGSVFLRYFAASFDQAWGALEPLDVYLTRH